MSVFNGPGRYDAQCTEARAACGAKGLILIVWEGSAGAGFEVQGPLEMILQMPGALRDVAAHIEAQIEADVPSG